MSIKTFELISTTENGVQLISYVALPENAADDKPVAGVLVAPEWWGLVEHSKTMTERLAKAGYAAVAMDVYGEGKMTSDAAMATMWHDQVLADQEMLMARCRLILNDFSDQLAVDGDNLAAIGFCFGGKVVLDMAREGMPVKAVATFHGDLSPKQPADKNFKAKVLIAHGRDDAIVTMDDIETFKKEMDAADVDYTVDVYDNAKHGFTNPKADERDNPNLGYDETADKQSWDNMLEFMKANLG
ncbi:dienelactone hydrolase family protein [Psychrobacter frigidicola]|uniref:Dienelactone hydrolase family protein n=1 Tax=Psychrobacter frigidicola TaxID=45611 RepID=A0A5C7A011_9GAMM|nr:dienelactone hydrolase family protein [Psychrobacter frigidicola]TXD96134.1 dienelactone hydrolase family protein [Psychrobacter frigidicola]